MLPSLGIPKQNELSYGTRLYSKARMFVDAIENSNAFNRDFAFIKQN